MVLWCLYDENVCTLARRLVGRSMNISKQSIITVVLFRSKNCLKKYLLLLPLVHLTLEFLQQRLEALLRVVVCVVISLFQLFHYHEVVARRPVVSLNVQDSKRVPNRHCTYPNLLQAFLTQSGDYKRDHIARLTRMARNDGHACAQRLVNKEQFYQTSMLKFIGVTLGK